MKNNTVRNKESVTQKKTVNTHGQMRQRNICLSCRIHAGKYIIKYEDFFNSKMLVLGIWTSFIYLFIFQKKLFFYVRVKLTKILVVLFQCKNNNVNSSFLSNKKGVK